MWWTCYPSGSRCRCWDRRFQRSPIRLTIPLPGFHQRSAPFRLATEWAAWSRAWRIETTSERPGTGCALIRKFRSLFSCWTMQSGPPPTTKTVPFGSNVAVWSIRAVDILPVGTQAFVTTDTDAVALTDPMAADMLAEPSDTPDTRPVVGPTVAMDGVPEVQLAAVVTFCMLPSEKVPVAVSWVVVGTTPMTSVAGLGVIFIDSTIADVTVSVVLPDTDPEVAVISVEPGANAIASPSTFIFPKLLMVALNGVPEVQLTLVVRSAVLVSENIPRRREFLRQAIRNAWCIRCNGDGNQTADKGYPRQFCRTRYQI